MKATYSAVASSENRRKVRASVPALFLLGFPNQAGPGPASLEEKDLMSKFDSTAAL